MKMDYTAHPSVKSSEVDRLKGQNFTFREIATIMKVSPPVVEKVYHASHPGISLRKHGRRPYRNYLRYPGCSPSDVVRMRDKGEAFAKIGRTFGVSEWIAKRVFYAKRPDAAKKPRPREKWIDYLHHPRAALQDVLRKKNGGKIFSEIGKELGTSKTVAMKVYRAGIAG